jgi:hypothetical protein
VRREADAILDFQEMARRALGAHWQDLSETDRRRLTVRLADLVERTYAPMIEAFRGEHIVHAGDVVDRDRAMVTMRVVSARGSEMPVDFLMRRREDRWRVYDVSIRGVSLVESYRAEFDRIVKAASRDALVAADWHGHHPGPASDPPRAVAAPGPAGPATMPPVRRRIAPSRERVTAEALQLAIARRERRGRPGQQRLVAPPVPVPPEGPHERIDALLQEPADVAAPGQRPCQGVRVESQHAEKAVPPAQELGGGRG